MFEVVVLAAGQSARMHSNIPKVLHSLSGMPILSHVLHTVALTNPDRVHVVIQPEMQATMEELFSADIHWVHQHQPLGTGDAVKQALPAISPDSNVMVLMGDAPLLSTTTLLQAKATSEHSIVVVTATVDQPQGYGRIVRTTDNKIQSIVEDKDATEAERALREINSGAIGGPVHLLADLLNEITPDNHQQEFYLTDVVKLATEKGLFIESVSTQDSTEVLGVNDRAQLANIERILARRRADRVMQDGTTLNDPNRFDLRGELSTGVDCTIDVNVVIEGKVTIGDRVDIGPGCILRNTDIGDDVSLQAYSMLDSVQVGHRCSIGPFARIRPGSNIGEDSRIGNFVEVKASQLGAGVKANHLAYIGNTTIGDGTNFGAGAVTCNFDGRVKHQTVIGNDVFIGTNSTLVAPLFVQNGSFVAAGSTVTQDVKEKALVVGRCRQRTINRWVPPARRKKT